MKPPEAPRLVGSVGNPALGVCDTATGDEWFSAGGPIAPAAFYRDPLGVVRLTGNVRCPVSPEVSVIFTLPAGYIPSAGNVFFVTAEPSVGKRAEIAVTSDGRVIFRLGDDPGPNGAVALDGIAFRCAPSGANGCP